MRWRLRWHYGDALEWTHRMIVLTLEEGEAERLAEGAPNLQRQHGMPIDPRPFARTASSEPACRAVVAARVHAPEAVELLLRALRVRLWQHGLLDDPALIAAAASDAGLDPAELAAWGEEPMVERELRSDIRAARDPAPAARALDHKLGGPPSERRYTAPSYELRTADRVLVIPGFTPVEAYEAAIANLAPELERAPRALSIEEVLRWAGEPLATAEVALIMAIERDVARRRLEQVAVEHPAGADAYWTLAG